MLEFDVPGAQPLRLAHLVADFNGTLAIDGVLIAGVAQALRSVSGRLEIHVVTADTSGLARQALAGLPCTTTVLTSGDQDTAKLRYVERLGADRCVCIGNGRNDRLMLAASGLGIAVIQGRARRWKRFSQRGLPHPTSARRWDCCSIASDWSRRCECEDAR